MSLLKKKTSVKKTEKEKIEERREEILSQGRKFKYPLQYAKHKVVLWTVIIATLALAVMAGIGYLALYKFQNTGDMLYRLTKIIPAPVATIDGAKVRYSDYLMIYKSSIKPLEQQKQLGDDKDSETMRVHYKREALNEAENYTYALKLAEELGVKVSDKAVERAILRHRKAGGLDRSNESFEKVLHDNFGLTKSEYKRLIYLGLAKAEVAQKIDKKAERCAFVRHERRYPLGIRKAERGRVFGVRSGVAGSLRRYEAALHGSVGRPDEDEPRKIHVAPRMRRVPRKKTAPRSARCYGRRKKYLGNHRTFRPRFDRFFRQDTIDKFRNRNRIPSFKRDTLAPALFEKRRTRLSDA